MKTLITLFIIISTSCSQYTYKSYIVVKEITPKRLICTDENNEIRKLRYFEGDSIRIGDTAVLKKYYRDYY